MKELTLHALNENPWNVLALALPAFPTRLLLEAAQISATCLRQIASEAIKAIDSNSGEDWLASRVGDPHDMFRHAHRKIGEICGLLQTLYDVPVCDFWLGRNARREKSLFAKCYMALRNVFN